MKFFHRVVDVASCDAYSEYSSPVAGGTVRSLTRVLQQSRRLVHEYGSSEGSPSTITGLELAVMFPVISSSHKLRASKKTCDSCSGY